MKKTVETNKKRPGPRKAYGRGEGILVRFHTPLLETLDAWRMSKGAGMSRADAIRRFTAYCLKAQIDAPVAPPTGLELFEMEEAAKRSPKKRGPAR